MADDEATKSALLKASTPPSRELFRDLISANHILHYHRVLDAFGHISVRNPQNSETFFLSRNLAPALVAERADIAEYYVRDASPVDKDGPRGYLERFIHSEVYKMYKDVNSVIHSHNEAVLPFTIGSVPLQAVYHMAGVMGAQVPVYDIDRHYNSSDSVHSLLVVNEHLGAALAAGFNPTSLAAKATNLVYKYMTSSESEPVAYPPTPTVLMRGHGFTCVGTSIQEAVYRAMFICSNARVQTTALLMQSSVNVGHLGQRFAAGEKEHGPAKYEPIKPLSDRECKDAGTALLANTHRPWELWCAEVADASLYKNALL